MKRAVECGNSLSHFDTVCMLTQSRNSLFSKNKARRPNLLHLYTLCNDFRSSAVMAKVSLVYHKQGVAGMRLLAPPPHAGLSCTDGIHAKRRLKVGDLTHAQRNMLKMY